MFPLIKPVKIFKDYEQVFVEEAHYCLVVYRQFKDGDKVSEGTDMKDTTEMDCDLPEKEDPYKEKYTGGDVLCFHQGYYMSNGTHTTIQDLVWKMNSLQ